LPQQPGVKYGSILQKLPKKLKSFDVNTIVNEDEEFFLYSTASTESYIPMPVMKSILDYLRFDSPTNEQKSALLAMANFVKGENKDDFLILCGAAGTGKTSITSALIGYLNQLEIQYKVAAPTSRAARILGKKTNVPNSTIHAMIYLAVANPETGEVHFKLKSSEEEDYCIFIVDEASMINAESKTVDGAMFFADNSLLHDLTKYIKDLNPKNKLILLGDKNQLPPIFELESYALMPDYLSEKYGWKGTSHVLTEVKRQNEASYILKNAVKIRQGIDDGKKVEEIEIEAFKFNTIYQCADQYAIDFKTNKEDFCISIGCTHKSNQLFNQLVRERLFGRDIGLIVKGDLMLVLQSWMRNEQKLYNGDHVIVEEVNMDKIEAVGGLHFVPAKLRSKNLAGEDIIIEDYVLLDIIPFPAGNLPNEKEKSLRKDRNTKNKTYKKSGDPQDDPFIGAIRLTYGHAITCNKAQGGEWEKVYMNTFFMPSLKWAYTAVTRAKTTLVRY
jgi:AAA domain-containing protein/UvrD-like helicase family protein